MSDAVTLAWIGAGAAVASGLIGAGSVLLGVTITARRESSRARAQRVQQDEEWQRGQRRDAYARVLQASAHFDWCAVDYHDNFRDDPSNPMDYKLTAACEEAYLRLENATSEVMLLGTIAAARAANDLTSQAVAMVNLIDKKRISEKTWREAREKLGVLRNSVLLTARRDLGVDPGEHRGPEDRGQLPVKIAPGADRRVTEGRNGVSDS